jgi:hypothetical protein
MRAASIRTFIALLLFSGSIDAATQAQLDAARNTGLAWLYTHQNSTGQWQSPGGLPVQTTAAALDALRNAGIARGYYYAGAVAWLRNAEALSNDALAKQIAALSGTGTSTQALLDKLIAARTDTSKAWGAFAKYQGSFPDTALAMDAILLSSATYADTSTTLGFITNKQAAGGWSYSASSPVAVQSQIIPTAYNTLVLSRAKLVGWGGDSYITNSVNWLVARKKADNGFAEDAAATNGSVFETALVYLAIAKAKQANNAAAVAAQAVLDGAQDFLVNKQGSNGGWNDDAMATALALQALPTVILADTDKDGIPDGVEPLLATNSATPDGRHLVVGNGDSVSGTTTSVILASQELDNSMNVALQNISGTGPYTWSIVSGSLPTGVALNSGTGVISGMPSTAGTFNFTYQVKDSLGATVTTVAQLSVFDVQDADIPTLPEWAAILMAMLLAFTALRQQAHRSRD